MADQGEHMDGFAVTGGDRVTGAAQGADDIPTLLAAGVVAYVAETMLHEAAGHGGACVVSGLHFTMLAPLWMRCSAFSPAVVASGPAMNVLAACVSFLALRFAPMRQPVAALLFWLSFVFNALVACGYLAVGALTGFGDWPALFAWVDPPWAWRVPAAFIAAASSYVCLLVAASLFRRFAGSGAVARSRLWRRAMWPACGAAAVACLAEIVGGRWQLVPLMLALGCTVVVGFSLTSMDGAVAVEGDDATDLGPFARSVWLVAAGLAVGVGFVLVVGPGLDLSGYQG
jgi:hypothetical protein